MPDDTLMRPLIGEPPDPNATHIHVGSGVDPTSAHREWAESGATFPPASDTDPRLAENFRLGHRSRAALTDCGRSQDAAHLIDPELARWRAKALCGSRRIRLYEPRSWTATIMCPATSCVHGSNSGGPTPT